MPPPTLLTDISNTLKQVRFRSPLVSPANNRTTHLPSTPRQNAITYNPPAKADTHMSGKQSSPVKSPTSHHQGINRRVSPARHVQSINIEAINQPNFTHASTLQSSTYIIAIAMAVCIFIVLNSTAYPTISGGDAGELAVVACNLSLAHPPGYPLFTMLAHVFTYLPAALGHAAYRIVLFNILCSSLCAALLFLLCVKMTHGNNILCCTMSSLIFTFSHTVWLYTIQVEVFPLNNLLCAALLYTTVCYFDTEQQITQYDTALRISKQTDRRSSAQSVDIVKLKQSLLYTAYIGAMLCGLAMTNQHTTIFYVVPIILSVTWNLFMHNLLDVKSVCNLTLCLLLGLSPYMYLPVRSLQKPVDGWGDQSTLSGFLTHLLRQEYGTFQLAASELSSNTTIVEKLIVYMDNTVAELMPVTVGLAVIGVIGVCIQQSRSNRITTALFIVCYIVYTFVFHYLANLDHRPLFLGVQARFWQQPNMLIAVYAVPGLISAVELTTHLILFTAHTLQHLSIQQSVHTIYRVSHSVCAGIAVLLACIQIGRNYRLHDHSGTDMVYLYGYNQLNTFPANSLVLLNGDLNNNALKYAQQCEGVRTDVQLIGIQQMSWPWFVSMHKDNYPNVTFPGHQYHPFVPGAFSMQQFLDSNQKQYKQKLFLCGPFKDGDNSLVVQTQPQIVTLYEELPYGLCRKLIHTKHGIPTGKKLIDTLTAGLDGVTYGELPRFDGHKITDDMWEYIVYNDQFDRLLHITSYLAFYSNKDAADNAALIKLCKHLYDRILERESEFTALNKMTGEVYRSAGVIYGMYSQTVQTDKDTYDAASRSMFDMWGKYVTLKPSDNEIRSIVNKRVNPYTNRQH